MPFEIKSIYGLENKQDENHEAANGEMVGLPPSADEDDGAKECLVCLSETKNTIIMPCGHLCVCYECG
jgi:hypothetical protein